MIYALNAKSLAVSEYTGLTISALATHDGVLYGMDATSLLSFSGDADQGVDVDAHVLSGKARLGDGRLARWPRAYVGGTASDGMDLTVTTQEDGQVKARSYPKAAWLGDFRERIAKLAQGALSRWIQIKVANRDGGTLKIEQLDVAVEKIKRRG